MLPIKELDCASLKRQEFEEEVVAHKQPVVLRELVGNWPLVKQAQEGIHNTVNYLARMDSNHPCYTVVAPPSAMGRLFYANDLSGPNFQQVNAALTPTLQQLLTLDESTEPQAVSVQAAVIKDCLPSFSQSHTLDLLEQNVEPTLWVSNQSRVAAHFDLNDNIACVAAGRRRFTLFPPDQVSNLYVGPNLN